MKKHIIPHSPAWAAIAAVLAFSSTPLLAQTEVAPVAAPPIVMPTLPAAPPMAITPTAPQPVMTTTAPEMTPVAPAEAKPMAKSPIPKSVVQTRTPVQTAPAKRIAPVTRVTPATATPAKPLQTISFTPIPSAPSAPIVTSPVASSAPSPSDTMQRTVTDTGISPQDGLEWGLVGGIALLLGAGGAMALRRRTRSSAQMSARATTYAIPPAAPKPMARADTRAAPATTADLIPARVYASSVPAASWHGRTIGKPAEALAAQAPSPENPFLTRKNRLRRAAFLLRTQQGAPDLDSRTPMHAAVPTPAAPVVRQQPIYDFGRDAPATMRMRFKPATT